MVSEMYEYACVVIMLMSVGFEISDVKIKTA